MKKIILFLVPVIAIGAVVFFYSKAPNKPATEVVSEPVSIIPDSAKATTTTITGKPVISSGYNGQAMSYLADPKFLDGLPQDVVAAGKKRLDAAIKLIGQYPKDPDNWIELGLTKKIFENYIGARDAWEYVKKLDSEKAINYYNLGNLYGSYLKDNTKAESNYIKTVQLDPYNSYAYLGLADFYKNFYTAKSGQVTNVLLAGLKVLPNDPAIIMALATYYRDQGDAESAILYFEKYLTADSELDGLHRQLIQQEIDKLKFN